MPNLFDLWEDIVIKNKRARRIGSNRWLGCSELSHVSLNYAEESDWELEPDEDERELELDKEAPSYIIWSPSEKLNTTEKRMHTSLKEAKLDALQCSQRFPGYKFIIMQTIVSYEAVYEHKITYYRKEEEE